MVEARYDLAKILHINRRPASRKVSGLGAWERCMIFQTYTNVVQVVLIAAFGTRMFDVHFSKLGLSRQAMPRLWTCVNDGIQEDCHVSISIKVISATALTLVGFGVVWLVKIVVGDREPLVELKMARDDYIERKREVREADESLLQQPSPQQMSSEAEVAEFEVKSELEVAKGTQAHKSVGLGVQAKGAAKKSPCSDMHTCDQSADAIEPLATIS